MPEASSGEPAETLDEGPNAEADDDLVLPWWFSWWRVALVTGLATVALTAIVAMVANRQPGDDSAEVGFLRDMRDHHDQAILMAFSYLDAPDTDLGLRVMAGEIITGQSAETGMMIELMQSWRVEEENSTGMAMGWMGHSMPIGEMPGMASETELDALAVAEGPAADALFVELMNAHHRGGVEMSRAAVAQLSHARAGELAAAFARNQEDEIAEMTDALAHSVAG